MIDLTVELKADDTLAFLGAVEKQIPYATSVAINRTLDDAQRAIRAGLRGDFILRRPDFIDKTIYIGKEDRARKDNLEGTVRVDPRRNMLAKFEDDTEKRAQGSGKLAIPILRASDKSLILARSHPLNFRRLMNALNAAGGKTARVRERRRKGEPRRLINGRDIFIQRSAKGETFIAERIGRERRILYSFAASVPIKPVLDFKKTAHETALRVWEARAAEAIDRAIATAK